LGRQLKGRGLLLQKSLKEILQLTLENDEPVPTLRQVLELVGDRALLNIEIKGPHCVPVLVEQLTAFTQDHQLSLDHYLVSSFDHQQLFQMLQAAPAIKRGVLMDGIPYHYAQCCDELKAYSFNTNLG